jgi:hypothetical protein
MHAYGSICQLDTARVSIDAKKPKRIITILSVSWQTKIKDGGILPFVFKLLQKQKHCVSTACYNFKIPTIATVLKCHDPLGETLRRKPMHVFIKSIFLFPFPKGIIRGQHSKSHVS